MKHAEGQHCHADTRDGKHGAEFVPEDVAYDELDQFHEGAFAACQSEQSVDHLPRLSDSHCNEVVSIRQ